MEPYLLQLHRASEMELTEAACVERNTRLESTNASVSVTDIGQTASLQHQAASRIAQEF